MSAMLWIGASQVMRRVLVGENLGGLGRAEIGVFEPCVREGFHDPLVEHRVGSLVDDRALVHALEVDRVDGTGLDQVLDELRRPGTGRVQLETERRVKHQALGDRLQRWRLTEPHRRDVPHRSRLTP